VNVYPYVPNNERTNREYKERKMLEDLLWTVFFKWVKAHVEIQGNVMADHLAKKAAMDDIGEIVYDKTPRETIITEQKEMAGAVDKLYQRSSN
jgi:ribonuclease HI